jgi:hypothetical protein
MQQAHMDAIAESSILQKKIEYDLTKVNRKIKDFRSKDENFGRK